MSAFDIPPHTRRSTHLAMGVLALVAAAAFTQGFLRQLSSDTPAPPPRTMPGDAAIAEATPAPIPALQVATAPKPRKAPAETDDAAPPTLDIPAAPGSPDAGVTAPVAADASANAPATAAPSPPPAATPEPEAAPT
jgi:hypothetical protein